MSMAVETGKITYDAKSWCSTCGSRILHVVVPNFHPYNGWVHESSLQAICPVRPPHADPGHNDVESGDWTDEVVW